FSSRRRHTRFSRDWSSDVCSSDLALRAGRANLTEAYAIFREGEAWLLGCHITPLSSASTHVEADPTRTRKLLLHRREIDRLMGRSEERRVGNECSWRGPPKRRSRK